MRALPALVLLVACSSQPEPKQPEPSPPAPKLPSQDPSVPFPAWQLPESAAGSAAKMPQRLAEMQATDDHGSRCPEKLRERLVLFDGETRSAAHDLEQALALPGSFVVEGGRHGGERGLPLAALVGDGATLEVWPCRGEALHLKGEDLRAEPGRYVLVRSGKGTFKLLDGRTAGSRPVLKNLAAIRRP